MSETRRDLAIQTEVLRYIGNGLFATLVHFTVLTIGMEVVGLSSAALANFIAAIFGILSSFLGNRYFVFQQHSGSLAGQATRFVALYAGIAALHAGFLLLWTDLWGLDYRVGFLLALAIQVVIGYLGNKSLVFAE